LRGFRLRKDNAMPATLRHFAINADDVARARTFYETVFDWSIDPWGPPGFYQIGNAGPGVLGALQERHELVPGKPVHSVQATFGVADLLATIAAIEAAGGRIIMPPYRIEGVGELTYFEDTEGNFIGAMQYDAGVFD
jgi:predicted enzyme related to lactoylglutathione lyase